MIRSFRQIDTGCLVALCALWLASCGQPLPAAGTGNGGFTLPETIQNNKKDADVEMPDDVSPGDEDIEDTGESPCGEEDICPEDTGEEDTGEPVDSGTLDTYTGPVCTINTACKGIEATPWCATAIHQCVECLIDMQCPQIAGETIKCTNYKCEKFTCKPGAATCNGTTFIDLCGTDGASVTTTSCPDNKPNCFDNACHVCQPGKTYCGKPPAGSAESKTLLKCNGSGTSAQVLQNCTGGQLCMNGKCQTCQPGQMQCDGDKGQTCKSDGSGYEVTDCGLNGQTCQGGLCVNPCAYDPKSKTNVGCNYWAVDLDNAYVFSGTSNPDGTPKYYDAQNAQFSVIVSNTKDKPAQVKVTAGPGFKSVYTVAGGALKIINLPDPLWKIKPLNQDGTNRNKAAYKIESDQPIVAYQFNPLQNFDVFSNDASLLLPTNGIGTEYWVMTREQTGDLRGYFTIVAAQPGKTLVHIVSSASTLAGACYKNPTTGQVEPFGCNNAVAAMKKGDEQDFELEQGEVLTVESNASGADLTGSYIKADKEVVVFGGSESSNSPNTDHCINGKCENQGWACTTNDDCPRTCCQDHLEEQLFPVASWGTKYLATKLHPRGKEKDAWRIMASIDGTTVTTDPVVANIPVLNKGQWFEFESEKDFSIVADKPVLIGQFMAGAYSPNPNMDECTTKFANQSEKICTTTWAGTGEPVACKKNSDCPNMFEPGDAKVGDPDFAMLVPQEQYLPNYVFLVPGGYDGTGMFINVVLAIGSTATLDNKLLPADSFTPFTAGWTVGRFPVTPGAHTLACPTKNTKNCGLTVYGWAPYVSFSYPGGVALK